jgi:4-hydroxy-2-oxoheptanedioate aldolase
LRTNSTKAKLKRGETVFGCFTRYANASLVEVMSYHGWDFIVFDGEHGLIEPADCENMVRSAELHDVTPIIRVPNNQPHIILRFMDTGAHGLHVPWVNSADEAEAVVQSVKYGPRGIRGLAGVRASDFAQAGTFGDYVQKANEETLVVIHIETIDAVNALPEIIKIDGLDVIFIGPTDLSQSLGVPGQAQHPKVLEAIDRVIETVKGSDKAVGIMVPNAQAAKQYRDRGLRYISIGFESLLKPAALDYLKAARG